MNLQTKGQSAAKDPAQTRQKPSQNVPRKVLGPWPQRGLDRPSCPAFAKPTDFPFAPGVIDIGPEPEFVASLVDFALAVAAIAAVVAVLGFASGYLNLPGWLL